MGWGLPWLSGHARNDRFNSPSNWILEVFPTICLCTRDGLSNQIKFRARKIIIQLSSRDDGDWIVSMPIVQLISYSLSVSLAHIAHDEWLMLDSTPFLVIGIQLVTVNRQKGPRNTLNSTNFPSQITSRVHDLHILARALFCSRQHIDCSACVLADSSSGRVKFTANSQTTQCKSVNLRYQRSLTFPAMTAAAEKNVIRIEARHNSWERGRTSTLGDSVVRSLTALEKHKRCVAY